MNNEEKILAILEEHSKMFQKMQTDITGMKGDITGMKGDITGIKARLDYDVDVRLKAINEDIDVISKKLEVLDEVKELAEQTADQVAVIKAAVTQHGTAISELKRAE